MSKGSFHNLISILAKPRSIVTQINNTMRRDDFYLTTTINTKRNKYNRIEKR